MQLLPLLSHIGFEGKEKDIYMTCMQLGQQPASIIAERLGLNRVTTYMVLKRLVEKGLATMCTRNKMHYFSVESPQSLLEYVSRKEEEWKVLQKKLRSAIDDLEKPIEQINSPISASSYLGIEGCKSLFSQALRAKKLVLVLDPRKKPDEYKDIWIEVFFRQLMSRMPQVTHIFLPKGALDSHLIEKLEEKGAEVYLLDHVPFSVDLILCDDKKTGMIAEQNGILSGALIEGAGTQNSLQEFFTKTLYSLAGGFNFLVNPLPQTAVV